jgi:hypothetical protein
MLLAAEIVDDIPVLGPGLAGYAGATLDVLGDYLLPAADIGAHRSARSSATDSGEIIAATTADLVTEYATDYGTGNCAGYVRTPPLLHDLFTLDPASLLGRSDHRVN